MHAEMHCKTASCPRRPGQWAGPRGGGRAAECRGWAHLRPLSTSQFHERLLSLQNTGRPRFRRGSEEGGMERLCELGFVHTGSALKEHFTFLKDDDISKLCDAIVQDYDSLTQPKISLSAASTAKNTPDRQVQPADSFDDSSSIGGKSVIDTHGRPYAFSS